MKKIPHPSKYSKELLPVLAKYAYGHILDPMGGTGKAGLLKSLNPRITKVTINELEKEWADQGVDNKVDEIIVGDAKNLSGRYDCIVTSPPYGNRMADNFKAGKPDSMRRSYVGDLGRNVSDGSVCCKHFGKGYEEMIESIYDSILFKISFDLFILNVSNFIRQFKEVNVIDWYKNYFKKRDFILLYEDAVNTRRQKGVGANTQLRVSHEVVMVFKYGGAKYNEKTNKNNAVI